MNDCETCMKRENCKRDIGIMFGGCNLEYVPNPEMFDCHHCSIDVEKEEHR